MPGVFTAEGIKEKAAAPPPAGGRLEAGAVGATPGTVSGFKEVGGVVGDAAVLPVDFGALSPAVSNGSGVTISDLTPGF